MEIHIGRALDAMRKAALWAALAACLVWWAPSLLLRLARLAASQARFALLMAIGDLLRAMDRTDAARRLYEGERDRCARRAAAIRARRGW